MPGVVVMLVGVQPCVPLRVRAPGFMSSSCQCPHGSSGASAQGVNDRRENRHTGKTGGRDLSAMPEKNTKAPRRVLVQNGRMLCPYCKSYLGRAVYGAKVSGVEIFCKSSRCHKHLRIEL